MLLMTVKGLVVISLAVYGFSLLLRKEDAAWVRKAPLTIFVAMFVIGMWGHNVWVAYIALLFAPIFAKSRGDAAALYCVVTVSMPQLYQQIMVGGLYVTEVTKYTFCALGLLIAFVLKREGSTPILKRSHFDLPVLIILVLEFMQARDPSVTATIRQCLPSLFTIIIPYFVLSRSLNSTEEVRRFLLALALAGFVMAAVATLEARMHWLLYKQMEGLLNVHRSVNAYAKLRAGMLRAPAAFPESTALGTFLAMAFMAAVVIRHNFASRGKFFVVLFVLLLGLAAANSRGAIISVGIGLLAQDFYCRRYGALSAKVVAGAGLYLFAMVAAQFSAFFAALMGKASGTAVTTDYRVQVFQRGMQEIAKHPYLGQSLKTALGNLEDLRQGEGIIDIVNGYISYGLTFGYPGMILLALAFVSLCLAMWLARRKFLPNKTLLEFSACVFSVAAFSIFNSFFTTFGGEGSTAFYQICAVGSALWAMRSVSAQVQSDSGAPVAAPLSGIAAMIAADRARAGAEARSG
jgi:hypothetical protein